MRSFVIDTDTASDDAIALLEAVRHPEVEIRLVTLVAGNVPIETGLRNALITLDLAGAPDVPVHRGCDRPMLRSLETAQDVHGDDGMGGAVLPDPIRKVSAGHAVTTLLDLAAQEPGVHDLVTLGPLTNIAAALLIDPDLLTRFRHTWMMIGARDGHGNVPATGEFNAWADPEAAALVFAAAGAKTMIGWDVSRTYAVLGPAEEATMRTLGPLGVFASDINDKVREFATGISGLDGFDLPDPVAMAVALDPTLITHSEDLHMAVSTDAQTRGMTYADHRLPAPVPNVRVVTAVDEARFKALLFDLLKG